MELSAFLVGGSNAWLCCATSHFTKINGNRSGGQDSSIIQLESRPRIGEALTLLIAPPHAIATNSIAA